MLQIELGHCSCIILLVLWSYNLFYNSNDQILTYLSGFCTGAVVDEKPVNKFDQPRFWGSCKHPFPCITFFKLFHHCVFIFPLPLWSRDLWFISRIVSSTAFKLMGSHFFPSLNQCREGCFHRMKPRQRQPTMVVQIITLSMISSAKMSLSSSRWLE